MSKKRNPRVQITFKTNAQGIELIRRGLDMIEYFDRVESLRHVLADNPGLAWDLVVALTKPMVTP